MIIKTDKISQQPENCENSNDSDLVQAFLKKWWVESDFKAPNTTLTVNFDVYFKIWRKPSWICGILYFNLNGIDDINEFTNRIKWKDIIETAEREIKGSA